jgi:hypothetical protein
MNGWINTNELIHRISEKEVSVSQGRRGVLSRRHISLAPGTFHWALEIMITRIIFRQ